MMHEHIPLPVPDVLKHVVDVHCHPTDKPIPPGAMENLGIRICAMATRADDQSKVRDLALQWPDKVIPCFGWHPWTSHQISLVDPAPSKRDHYSSVLLSSEPSAEDITAFEEVLANLPEPISLATILDELRTNLTAFPNALLGEVGIDRAFKIPYLPYPGPGNKKLTPFTVPLTHQLAILEAQVDLAIELRRSVSVHSVKSQQATVEFFKNIKKKHGDDFGKINFDLHSCGFSVEMWRDFQKNYLNAFLSLSIVINGKSSTHKELIRSCSPNRILAESDFNNIELCTPFTWDMINEIGQLKGWNVESEGWDDNDGAGMEDWGVVRRLEANWKLFSGPGLGLAEVSKKESRKVQKLNDPSHKWNGEWQDESDSDEEDNQE